MHAPATWGYMYWGVQLCVYYVYAHVHIYTHTYVYKWDSYGADASAEGVQRDLLPLIEGSTISTKYGNVKSKFLFYF